MALSWDDTKRLLRLQGTAEELLACARTARDPSGSDAVERQLDRLTSEVQSLLAAREDGLAEEFDRIVVAGAEGPVPADLRGAALVGWLKAALAAESLEQRMFAEAAQRREEPKRKHTIGFKIRSPVTRAPEPEGSAEPTQN